MSFSDDPVVNDNYFLFHLSPVFFGSGLFSASQGKIVHPQPGLFPSIKFTSQAIYRIWNNLNFKLKMDEKYFEFTLFTPLMGKMSSFWCLMLSSSQLAEAFQFFFQHPLIIIVARLLWRGVFFHPFFRYVDIYQVMEFFCIASNLALASTQYLVEQNAKALCDYHITSSDNIFGRKNFSTEKMFRQQVRF